MTVDQPGTPPGKPFHLGDRDTGWAEVLTAVLAAGSAAGHTAAQWWAQHTLGASSTGDPAVTAARIRTALDDGDSAVLDTLASVTVSHSDGEQSAADMYAEAAPLEAPRWEDLDADRRQAVIAVFCTAAHEQAERRISELCSAAVTSGTAVTGTPVPDNAKPDDGTAFGRGDWAHLDPDRLRIGGVGVFAGDWAWTQAPDGQWRIPVGFVGTLIDRWNGWAVFACSRQVADAIVADQHRIREQSRAQLRAEGVPEPDIDGHIDAGLAVLSFDGDTLVADQRAAFDDPDAIDRIEPRADGRYVVMGWNWCWQAVDVADCDRIAGDLPAAHIQQEFVLLAHTDLKVPHDRLRVSALQRDTANPLAYTATLSLDGTDVGMIRNDGDGDGDATALASPAERWGWQRMADYAAGCSHHGRPVTVEQVYTALVEEFETGETIRAAQQAGAAVVRLRDTGGDILDVLTVHPGPASHSLRRALATQLAADRPRPGGHLWEIWSGGAWRHLGLAGGAA